MGIFPKKNDSKWRIKVGHVVTMTQPTPMAQVASWSC